MVISSLAPRATQAIGEALNHYCIFKHVKFLPSSPSCSYLKYKLPLFKTSTIKSLPKHTKIIRLLPIRCLLKAVYIYLLSRQKLSVSLEANQAILDSLTRSRLSFKIFILHKKFAIRLFSEYYKFRVVYSECLLKSSNVDSLFIYHRIYIVWYAFIVAARNIDIPVVVAEPYRTAFKVHDFPIASNNPISLCFQNIKYDNSADNLFNLNEKLPWVHKTIVDDLGIDQQHSPDKLISSKRKVVILAHVVSDTKYLLTNTKLYDTYFEWTIDTVRSYLNNKVSFPLIIRFHPSSFHPAHHWSFHLLLKELKKLDRYTALLHAKQILLDLPWDETRQNLSYGANDIFITYQGSAVLDLAVSGIKSISMNPIHMNQEITFIPSDVCHYTSSVITDRFLSTYATELPEEFRAQARKLYSEYVKQTIKS